MTEDEMAGWHHQLDGHEPECSQGNFYFRRGAGVKPRGLLERNAMKWASF